MGQCPSEVNPDQNVQSRDSGIPTKINPGIPENREKFPGFPKIGNFPEIGIPEANGEFYFA